MTLNGRKVTLAEMKKKFYVALAPPEKFQ